MTTFVNGLRVSCPPTLYKDFETWSVPAKPLRVSFFVYCIKILRKYVKKYGKVLNIWKKVVSLHILTYKGSKNMDKTSLRQRVIDMQVGDSITIPVEEAGYTTIRGYASDLGFAYKRKYSTHRNREERSHTITRIQ